MIVKIAYAGVIENATPISSILINILNFLLLIFGFIGIIGLVFSGLFYLTAGGSEVQIEKAKKMTFYSVVGIVVALGGVLIVRQISSLLA